MTDSTPLAILLGAAKGIDGYLIFVGSSGLLLIFPM